MQLPWIILNSQFFLYNNKMYAIVCAKNVWHLYIPYLVKSKMKVLPSIWHGGERPSS